MPWYCGNCGNQGPYYRSDGPPAYWCKECGAGKESWRYEINPPAPYSKNIAGVDPAAGGFVHTRADEEYVARVRQASGGDHHQGQS